VFCSIATLSHRQQALACLDAIHRHLPEAGCALLLLLPPGAPAPALPPSIQLLRVEDCAEAAQLQAMQAQYTVAELCFALKPYLLAALLARGATQAHYLDADCMAYGSLAPLLAQLATGDLLLTPHGLSPIPDDGMTPRPLTLLRAGVFNAGYLGVRNTPQGLAFVAWLSAMTLKFARNAPAEGMCGDQRWLDLAPVLFPGTAICRHPGANVAYWNLHERQLTVDAQGGFQANGEPLLFFHFSGYELRRPEQLSRHQNRHTVQPGAPLQRLLQDYRSHLPLAAMSSQTGHANAGKAPGWFVALKAAIKAAIKAVFHLNPAETKQ
jgi:hypothetical protein